MKGREYGDTCKKVRKVKGEMAGWGQEGCGGG